MPIGRRSLTELKLSRPSKAADLNSGIRAAAASESVVKSEPKARLAAASPSEAKPEPKARLATAPEPEGNLEQRSRSGLEDRFARSFKVGPSEPPRGTPGLFESIKQSAGILEKSEADIGNWFVAIDGAPVGPVSARKIHAYQRQGRVGDSSLVWKESMSDWAPLRECKELVGLLARIDLNGDTHAAPRASPLSSPQLGLFRVQPDTAESPLKGHNVGVIEKRLDDLFEVPEPAAGQDRAAAQAQLESSFFEAPTRGAADTLDDTETRMSLLRRMSLPRPVNQRRKVTVAAVGFLFVAIVFFLIQFLLPEKEYITEYVEKVVYRDRIVEVPSLVKESSGAKLESQSADSSEGAEEKVATGSSGSRARSRGSSTKGEPDEKTKRLMEQLGSSGPGSGGPKGRSTKKSAENEPGSGKLTESQLKGVVTSNRSRLKVCYERALKQGDAPSDRDIRVDFALVVGSSGTVKDIRLTGDATRYPSLSRCLENSVKRWVFPTSSTSSPVEFPFVFTPR